MYSKKKIKQINLIPLINIIFLMLIFFMLAGTITTIDPYKIKVPESIIKNDPLTPFLTIIVKKNFILYCPPRQGKWNKYWNWKKMFGRNNFWSKKSVEKTWSIFFVKKNRPKINQFFRSTCFRPIFRSKIFRQAKIPRLICVLFKSQRLSPNSNGERSRWRC